MKRIISVFVMIITGLWAVPVYGGDPDIDGARAALVGCAVNLSSFKRIQCKFTVARAQAATADAAVKGEFVDPKTCDYLFVKDGDKVRFESFASRAMPKLPKNA